MKKTAGTFVVLVVLVSLCAVASSWSRLLGPDIEGPLFQDIRPVPISELSADRFLCTH